MSRTRLSTKPFFLPVFRIRRGKREATSSRYVCPVLVLLKKRLKINKFFCSINPNSQAGNVTGSQALKVIQLQGIEKGNRTGHLCSWLVGYHYLLYAFSHLHSYTPIPTFIHPSTFTNLDTCSALYCTAMQLKGQCHEGLNILFADGFQVFQKLFTTRYNYSINILFASLKLLPNFENAY